VDSSFSVVDDREKIVDFGSAGIGPLLAGIGALSVGIGPLSVGIDIFLLTVVACFKDMAVGMFLYAFDWDVLKQTYENGVRTIEFASACIVNLQCAAGLAAALAKKKKIC
ncbi:MAG: hypothetical protein LBS82_03215, partial [Spirochaetaceae bacterium]|nr:hypothetical protein [Spirochaetaceae bacterium]